MNVMHLEGAERVERAASQMASAADKMAQAVRDMDYALGNHQRFLSDWLERLQGSISDLTEMLPSADEPIRVMIVRHPDADKEEDSHEAKTVPAPADHGPIELEGTAS